MALLSLVRVVHIALGVLAFVVLPVPLFTKKGSPRHVSFGTDEDATADPDADPPAETTTVKKP
jgi:predicted secreted protein